MSCGSKRKSTTGCARSYQADCCSLFQVGSAASDQLEPFRVSRQSDRYCQNRHSKVPKHTVRKAQPFLTSSPSADEPKAAVWATGISHLSIPRERLSERLGKFAVSPATTALPLQHSHNLEPSAAGPCSRRCVQSLLHGPTAFVILRPRNSLSRFFSWVFMAFCSSSLFTLK